MMYFTDAWKVKLNRMHFKPSEGENIIQTSNNEGDDGSATRKKRNFWKLIFVCSVLFSRIRLIIFKYAPVYVCMHGMSYGWSFQMCRLYTVILVFIHSLNKVKPP